MRKLTWKDETIITILNFIHMKLLFTRLWSKPFGSHLIGPDGNRRYQWRDILRGFTQYSQTYIGSWLFHMKHDKDRWTSKVWHWWTYREVRKQAERYRRTGSYKI